jgi:hypothetical protein
MNRLLRNIFFTLAVLLVVYSAAFANYLLADSQSVVHSTIIRVAFLSAIVLALAGWRFSLKNKFKILAVLLGLLLVEILLQAAAWLGVLPAMNTKIKAPFARVYWTMEGHGNSIRNRFGWHYPAFDLKAAHKIAYVGDSQVEALEVLPTQNQAADLQKLLQEKSPDWAVLGLGNRGNCLAHSIDVLEYAWRHFQPQEAIIAVSMGSDIAEASPKLVHHPPIAYIFYDLDSRGQLVLNPASARFRDWFDNNLELSHRSLLFNLPVILNSHCMIMQMIESFHDTLARRELQEQAVARHNGVLRNGFNPAPFAVDRSPEAQRAMTILIAQLQQCKNVCDSHGMKFRVVTIPDFPTIFFDTQHGRDWTMRIGDYDYFGPEREVTAWARTNGIPIVSMGEYIEQKKLDVDEIRSLYFLNGTGHLTPKGHALFARQIYETFYQKSAPYWP